MTMMMTVSSLLTYVHASPTSARCCPLWRKAHCVPGGSPVSGQRSLTATWRDVIMFMFSPLLELSSSHPTWLLQMSDSLKPSPTHRWPKWQTAAQTLNLLRRKRHKCPKRFLLFLLKCRFSLPNTPLKKKTVMFGLHPWYTGRLSGHHAVHLSPTRGHKRTIDKTSFLEPFAQKRLKVNKCDLKPWVPCFMLQFHPLQTCRIMNLSFSSSSSLQGIVLNNAKSWAQLMKQSAAPTAIKSSKNVFEQFRKAALEKEQRQKAMRLHQVDWSREWKAPQSSWYVPESSCSNWNWLIVCV